MRRAKIVCTLGPATATPETINGLVLAGMNVARLNLSHGDHEVHTRSFEMVRAASSAANHASLHMSVAIAADCPRGSSQTPASSKVKCTEGRCHARRGWGSHMRERHSK